MPSSYAGDGPSARRCCCCPRRAASLDGSGDHLELAAMEAAVRLPEESSVDLFTTARPVDALDQSSESAKHQLLADDDRRQAGAEADVAATADVSADALAEDSGDDEFLSFHDAMSDARSSIASGDSAAENELYRDESRRLSATGEFALTAGMKTVAAEAAVCGVADVEAEVQALLSDVAAAVEDFSVDPFWRHSSHHFGLRCLRARDFDRQAALRLLLRFAQFRKRVGWPYSVRLSGDGGQEVLQALLSGVHWLLPSPDADGRAVVVLRPGLIKGPVEPYHRMGCFLMQWATGLVPARSDPAPGSRARHLPSADMYITMVVDLSGIGPRLAARFGPADMERGIRMWQDSFPLKLRAIYLVNAGRLIGGLIGLAKTFIAAKLRDRISTFSVSRATGPGSLLDLRTKLGGREADIPREWGGSLEYSASDDGASTTTGWAAAVYAELELARHACSRQKVSPSKEGRGAYEWWDDWVDRGDDASLGMKRASK